MTSLASNSTGPVPNRAFPCRSILFVNPCLRPGSRRKFPPVGLACILTSAAQAGFDYHLFDMDAGDLGPDDLAAHLRRHSYDIVAFGAIVTSFRLIRRLARVIRQALPQAWIVCGNSVATSIPELLLRHTDSR